MDEFAQRNERLQELEKVDEEIIKLLGHASECLKAIGQDKTSLKHAETHCNSFIKTLQHIDQVLTQQMLHLSQVSTGVSHEGTHYDCAKEREINVRCSGDLEDQLQFLWQQHDLFLKETANEGPIVLDGDESMDTLPGV